MDTEPISNCCPKCQTPLPPDAPHGLCPKCLLAAVAMPTDAGQSSGRPTPPPLADIAAAFPQLEILEFIGQGGMGFVFKARQPKLDRLVALKILPQSLATDPTFAERFHREAKLLARLNHPGIVTVHDFGAAPGRAGSPLPAESNDDPERRARSDAPYLAQHPDASPQTQFFYLVMEFVDGVNLRQAMQAGRFTPEQALAIVPKICEALQFAHNEGILHRDIKPENILLDAKGRVKIADFGIAKLVGTETPLTQPLSPSDGERVAARPGEGFPQHTLTEAGKALGTPNYMAPEQLENAGEVDHRADIYSLGVVFYEMLTGELPHGRFALPSQKSSADPRVDEVVLRALEKEKAKRYSSADEVKTRVETIAGTPDSPRSQTSEIQESDTPVKAMHCWFSTTQYMQSFVGGFYPKQGDCELTLFDDRLVLVTEFDRGEIPLSAIHTVGRLRGPVYQNPFLEHFLHLQYDEGGWRKNLVIVPGRRVYYPTGWQEPEVVDWCIAIREAVRANTGRMPDGSISNPAILHPSPLGTLLVYGVALITVLLSALLSNLPILMVVFPIAFGLAVGAMLLWGLLNQPSLPVDESSANGRKPGVAGPRRRSEATQIISDTGSKSGRASKIREEAIPDPGGSTDEVKTHVETITSTPGSNRRGEARIVGEQHKSAVYPASEGWFGILLVRLRNGERVINWTGIIQAWAVLYGAAFVAAYLAFGRWVPLQHMLASLVGIVTWVTAALVRFELRRPIEPMPSGERAVESVSTEARKPNQDWLTWSPLQSQQVRDICAHLTKAERKHVSVLGLLISVCIVGTYFGVPSLLRSNLWEGKWIVAAVWGGLFIAVLCGFQSMLRHYLCSTAWARQQGFTPEKLPLFSFSRRNLVLTGAVLAVGLGLIFAQNRAVRNYLGLGSTKEPDSISQRPINAKLLGPTPTFGQVVERVLPLNAQGYSYSCDLGSGEMRIYPPGLARADWNSSVTLSPGIIVIVETNGGAISVAGTATLIEPLRQAAAWENLPPQEVKVSHAVEAGKTVTVTCQDTPPLTFAFRTDAGKAGLLQITGFTENPRGVKIRYKLVQRSVPTISPVRLPTTASARAATFGPVIQRVVNCDPFHTNNMIDLETGQLFAPPPRLGENAEESFRWIRDRGIDAYAFYGVTNSLIGYDLASHLADATTWDIATPQTIAGLLTGGKAGATSYLTTTNLLPITMAIRTRESTVGLLQITGFTENPRGVKIRYKLVQQMPDTVTQDPKPRSRSQSTQIPAGLVFSSAGGKVVLETTNGTLTADRIEFPGTNSLKATNLRMTFTNNAPVR